MSLTTKAHSTSSIDDTIARIKSGFMSYPGYSKSLDQENFEVLIAEIERLRSLLLSASSGHAEISFQTRVAAWMQVCFGEDISADKVERNHRFLEEALELVQACGCSQSEAHQLVDYVYGRDQGEANQEVGGVMVTLAALCLANGFDMATAGETELVRVWTKFEKIRSKQAAKPKHSPLPEAIGDADEVEAVAVAKAMRRNRFVRTGRLKSYDPTVDMSENEIDDARAGIVRLRALDAEKRGALAEEFKARAMAYNLGTGDDDDYNFSEWCNDHSDAILAALRSPSPQKDDAVAAEREAIVACIRSTTWSGSEEIIAMIRARTGD